MQPYQQRVVDEKSELDKKLCALGEFIEGNGIFEKLDAAEQCRLRMQRCVMQSYSQILGERIAVFS